MTAKTGKDEAGKDTADEVEAATEETPRTEPRPAAKRKRRVRVIEVIDDEDLDEVLEALDAEEDDEAEEEPAAKAAKSTKAAKPRPARLEPPEEDEEEAPKKVSVRKSTAPAEPAEDEDTDNAPARPGILGLTTVQAVVIVVLVALLASLGIWQWRTASGLSSEADEREAVRKVAAAYGDVAFNYNAQNYQGQVDKAQKLMGGDLLESYKANTLPQLGETFKQNPEAGLSSKTDQVFVGSVDGKFANAVVMVDIGLKTKDGSTSAPATLLRLALAKIDGEWKVTKQYASGGNDQNQGQAQGQLPTAPTAGASPNPETSAKPGD